jgi:hypothetical protein
MIGAKLETPGAYNAMTRQEADNKITTIAKSMATLVGGIASKDRFF